MSGKKKAETLRTTVGEIRSVVRSQFRLLNEAYDHDLLDDPAFNEESMLVPDSTKVLIKKYLEQMGLSNSRSHGSS